MARRLPNIEIVTVSPDEAYCGRWSTGPTWLLLRSVLAERAMIEATFNAGGRAELLWDNNGPRVRCTVNHTTDLT